MMTDADDLRRSYARILIGLLWAHVPVAAVIPLLPGEGGTLAPAGAATLLATLATLSWWRDPTGLRTRIATALALVGMAAVLLYASAGHPWQIDLHMYFFACLAVLAGWCDWRVILAATAATALHHLVLNLVLPGAVFPTGASLQRVLLHAGILTIEAAMLAWICRTVSGTLAGLARSEREAQSQMARLRDLERQGETAREAAEHDRRESVMRMAAAFEAAVGGIVGEVAAAAGELQATAHAMSQKAGSAAARSAEAEAAAGQAAGDVGAVAAATEELGASVREVGQQVGESAGLARAAVTEADRTAALVGELSEAASRIGDVVSLISGVADQTNLLALNATIEAARAGAAGRGFAVVAAEVKELASQTAKATQEISGQIGRIQGATGDAVRAIEAIGGRIRGIDGVAAAVAAAVEEQGAATREIIRAMDRAAAGTGSLTATIGAVAQAAGDTGSAAGRVLASADALTHQADHLGAEVARFLQGVRAA
ncbi:methyl-accepting chemotaxis protein [Methylobacterium sp. SyP6R]|uniref:methyl-accepting chemotaxis protein n=1 Tax=Methylobacterium sp. SyP6R TaxID=2718876 RepID=UPI001F008B7E|nr:methyl-accepting chemotaxis protein [Methylobacterium sp. SyP6R]MCF4128175.1 methyl-accepting chemotaxis protein [Methylobacterium sp. SyP6R]